MGAAESTAARGGAQIPDDMDPESTTDIATRLTNATNAAARTVARSAALAAIEAGVTPAGASDLLVAAAAEDFYHTVLKALLRTYVFSADELDRALLATADRYPGKNAISLLESGANPAAQDTDGRTLLHSIAISSRPPRKSVLDAIFDADGRSGSRLPPLRLECITDNQGMVPIEQAVTAAFVESMVERGLATDSAANLRSLERAIKLGLYKKPKSAVFAWMIKYTGLLHGDGKEEVLVALLFAVAKSNPETLAEEDRLAELVSAAIDAGADPKALENGITPLHVATSPRIISALLRGGHHVVFEKCKENGRTPLHALLAWGRRRSSANRMRSALEVHLAAGGSTLLRQKDVFGNTILHDSHRIVFSSVVQLLIAYGCDTSAKNAADNTPIQELLAAAGTIPPSRLRSHLEIFRFFKEDDATDDD
jgi:ankyrin repeat protein